jgi:protein phosphatase
MANDSEQRQTLSTPLGDEDFAPLSSTVRADIAARSRRGPSAPANDNHYLVVRLGRRQETLATSLSPLDIPRRFEEHGYGMLVADGLGSGGSGSVASRVALSAIAHLSLHYGRWRLRMDPKVASEVLARAKWFFEQAGEAVAARRAEDSSLHDMATALTAAFSAGDDLFVAHTGHTRAYLFRHGNLTQLTRDHTAERHHSANGGPIAVERPSQGMRHVLTDVIGGGRDVPLVDVEHFRLAHGDSLLLCSSGLTDTVGDDGITEILAARRRSSEQCRALISLAARLGSKDDVTAVVCQYDIAHQDG